ncbi:uncharacterized protein LOC130719950 [Lotus japonicus]|uniref:uncharacterized protein LOC130719950 n=1 Tax=Lotus japonicus TaxID=34305 RepID=UPI00258F7E72|nr:uncharacterized protein LOC130719950 [Lotus japonicus]
MCPTGSARVPTKVWPEEFRRHGGNGVRSLERGEDKHHGGFNLFVDGIDDSMTYQQLRQVFAQYGAIQRLFLQLRRRPGRRNRFAFVRFREEHAAREAIKVVNGAFINQSLLSVKMAMYESRSGMKGSWKRKALRSGSPKMVWTEK